MRRLLCGEEMLCKGFLSIDSAGDELPLLVIMNLVGD